MGYKRRGGLMSEEEEFEKAIDLEVLTFLEQMLDTYEIKSLDLIEESVKRWVKAIKEDEFNPF